MNIWIWGDPHFAHDRHHAKLVEWENRPDDYEDIILREYNQVVQSDDTSICLGDVCIGGNEIWERWVLKLQGNKVLVLGNHDSKTYKWYMGRGFQFACDTFTWYYHGFKIIFSHVPITSSLLDHYDINIHGHLHANSNHELPLTDKHILYSPELNNYKPIKLDTLLKGRKQHG